MTAPASLSLSIRLSGNNKTINQFNGFIILLFISATVFAAANGIASLPESYRTPLSDMTYDSNNEWRATPEEDNPWREDKEVTIRPRIKTEFFPQYDYDTVDDPTTRSLFQNEYELERPRTNIFKYSF